MSNKFFMAIFVVDTQERFENGRPKFKTISSYVSLFDRFEMVVNRFTERFAKQDYKLKEICVFTSDVNFHEDWNSITGNDSISWSRKNSELLLRRPDIKVDTPYVAEGYTPRDYFKK